MIVAVLYQATNYDYRIAGNSQITLLEKNVQITSAETDFDPITSTCVYLDFKYLNNTN